MAVCNLLVFLAIVSQDQVLKLHFNLHPLLIRQGRPDMMGFGNRRLVRLQDDLGSVVVNMKGSQDQDKPGECCVG